MEKGRIEFSLTSLEPGGNSETNGNVQIFCYGHELKLCIFQDNSIMGPSRMQWVSK